MSEKSLSISSLKCVLGSLETIVIDPQVDDSDATQSFPWKPMTGLSLFVWQMVLHRPRPPAVETGGLLLLTVKILGYR